MHREQFSVTADTLARLIENAGNIIPVGTTSLRTLESLYWLGVKLAGTKKTSKPELTVHQWEPYTLETTMNPAEALNALLVFLKERKENVMHASTGLIIIPGYRFRLIKGLVTNFHQPRSTLLLLVSAWAGEKWKEIYAHAIERRFRFLSYGDSSLLLK